jgi:signal transduction histidine kinase
MPSINLSVADAAGSLTQADAGRATRAALDWRQLSHELRTPLNAILGNAELLLDGSTGPLSAHARACLGEIQSAGRQLLRQVQLLLAWSELGAARPQLAERPVDLIALIRAALSEARVETVRVEPHDARLLVRGDRFWLQMLVAEITALNGALHPAPTVALDSGVGHTALRLPGPGFAQRRQVRCRWR